MIKPSVSVILVNYNGTKDTIDCVKSLLNVEYDNFRIVIADNASKHPITRADDAVLQDSRVEILTIDQNLGFAGGNNYAIKYEKEHFDPSYYLLLNNDTVVEPGFIKNMVRKAEMETDIGLVCGKIYLYSDPEAFWYAGGAIDISTGVTSHYGAKEREQGQYDVDREVTFATGCLWLIPQKTIEEVGLMNEDYFLYYEDADYCCRILNNGLKLMYCHDAVIYHKVSGTTGSYSDLERYYMVRNGLLFVHRYATSKMKAYSKHLFQYLKDLIKKRIRLAILVQAISDYTRGKYGKQKIKES